MNTTINYYNLNAKKFIENTQNADMHLTQDKFLQLLPESASILDFGCGSGRDTKYFLEKGYQVVATDGSAELCRLASSFTGIKVKEMLFQELDEIGVYDGIWACSSILHLPKQELLPVIRKMCIALKDNGVIYTSFKYSNFEGERKKKNGSISFCRKIRNRGTPYRTHRCYDRRQKQKQIFAVSVKA